jgi:hypothetical protein
MRANWINCLVWRSFPADVPVAIGFLATRGLTRNFGVIDISWFVKSLLLRVRIIVVTLLAWRLLLIRPLLIMRLLALRMNIVESVVVLAVILHVGRRWNLLFVAVQGVLVATFTLGDEHFIRGPFRVVA